MAERSVKIPSKGETTPEYNAVRKSYGDINPEIIREDFVSLAYGYGLIPTRNPSSPPPLDIVLSEISRDPVNYYSLQHVVSNLNVEDRFDEGIGKMEKTFQCKYLHEKGPMGGTPHLEFGGGGGDIQGIFVAVRHEIPPRVNIYPHKLSRSYY
jgi:hypothetical protein